MKKQTTEHKIMKTLLNMLKENNEYSLNRCTSVVFTITFIVASIWLIATQFNWSNYDMFATVTAGSGTGIPLMNKFINSKYNTGPGEAGKPPNTNIQHNDRD